MMARNFLRNQVFDRNSIRRNLKIFSEDHAILRNVKSDQVPTAWQNEVSVKSDALQIRFREYVRQLEKAGWKIDQDRIDLEYRGRRAVAVPCPARRANTMAWPIEEIPIVGSNRLES